MKLILVLILSAFNCQAATFDEFLKQSKISHTYFGKSVLDKNFKLVKNSSTHYLVSFYDQQDNFYDIEILTAITQKAATQQVLNFSNLLKLSYNDKPTPYGGIISNLEKCPSTYNPKLVREKFNNIEVEYFISAAGAHYQYGACTKETAVHKVCSLFHYQKETSTLIKLKYFVPFNNGYCGEGIKVFMTGLNFK
ncbi:MAG: hypothetical protein WC635_06870 [Bacteriovorax sp.]|jgi:hypothetical protein